MRKYVVGNGWRFELIDDELYFASTNLQWNYKIKDLEIIYRDAKEIIYIFDKNTQTLLSKICLAEEIFPTWSRVTLIPTKKNILK